VLSRVRARLRLERSAPAARPAVDDDQPIYQEPEPPSPPLTAPPLQRLLVADGDREVLVPLARVDRIEAEGNYVRLHAGDRSYLLRHALTAIEARLEPGRFLRANRSTLVRMDAIAEIQPWFHGDRRILLRDGSVVTWSRRYRARERDRFTVY
jgi:DNA-binding LytR/AlgR family response regulator